jgi:hypothetical protein
VRRLQAGLIAHVVLARHEKKASSYPSKKILFVLSKEWTYVVNARGRVAVWLTIWLNLSPVPHPCSLSHYLIGNATRIPDSRIETYS